MGKNDWKDRLRSGMEDFREPVPESVWTAVSAGVESVRRRRRTARRAIAWSGVLAAAAAVALVISPWNSGLSPDMGGPEPVMLADAVSIVPPSVPSPEPLAFPGAGRHSVPADGGSGMPSSGDAPDDATGGAPPVEPPPAVEPSGSPAPRPDTLPWADDPFEDSGDVTAVRHGFGRRISIALSMSDMGGSSSSQTGYGGMNGADAAAEMSYFSDVLLNNNSRPVSTSVRHYRPVTAGLSVSLGLTDMLSLESGLGYTCLRAELYSGTEDSHYDIRQTLHYIGIPLKLNLRLWQSGRLGLYASAGGRMDKCVGGSTSTGYVLDDIPGVSVRESISDVPLQWSVSASGGLQYDLGPLFSLYAEPGLSYYFDNGGFVETAFDERPLNFSLSVGLRFRLGGK